VGDRELEEARFAVRIFEAQEPHRIQTVDAHAGNPRSLDRGSHSGAHGLSGRREGGADIATLVNIEHGVGRREGNTFARERRGDPRATRRLHDVTVADDRGEGKAVRERFAEYGQVGHHIGQLVITARPEAKACFHLVEDEHRA